MAGGARPEAAPEPGETAHFAQKDAGSLLGGAGAARTPGPGGNGAARDRGKKTERRGGTPGLQQRRLHRISPRRPGGERAAAPEPAPEPRRAMGACEGNAGRHPLPRQASGA